MEGKEMPQFSHESEADPHDAGNMYPFPPFSQFFSISTQQHEGNISFQHWLDVSPDALIVVDATGCIVLVNRQGETLFGYTREELVGQPLEVLLPERFRAFHQHNREHYATSPRIRPMGAGLELYGRHKDGSEVPVDISLSPLHAGNAFYALAAIRDVTERRRLQEMERSARADAEARLELLQLILDELPTGVVLVQGKDARLVRANRAATTLWGVCWQAGQAMHEFLASSGIQFLTPDGTLLQPTELATVHAVRREETIRERQEVIRRADASITPVLVNAVTLGQRRFQGIPLPEQEQTTDAQDPTPVALVVYQDVTERIELERRKDEFIAMASHELRTPVTSIKTYMYWLRRKLSKQQDGESTAVLTRIDGQLDQLTRLIGELLDITQMETGSLPWHEQTFALDDLVAEITEDQAHTTDRHQILRKGGTSVQVYADRERIGQVLSNFLSNAIKYMPQGGIIIVRQEQTAEGVQVAVQDHGIGIPQDKQAQVFERFYRVRSEAHENFPGLGLGLYLCAEIVKRQGGRIWVESKPGVGSTFYFTLPTESIRAAEKGAQA
jgi:PAS domain S-box-containing protein